MVKDLVILVLMDEVIEVKVDKNPLDNKIFIIDYGIEMEENVFKDQIFKNFRVVKVVNDVEHKNMVDID